jgi:hypothetical protein
MRTVIWAFDMISGRFAAALAAVLLAVMQAAIVTSCAQAQPEKAPDFRFDQCVYADSLTLSEFSRFPVLLFFFDVGDVACYSSYAYLENWGTKYAADDLKVIGIQSSPYKAMQSWPNVADALGPLDFRFPIGLDYDGRVSDTYAVTSRPTWVLIKPGGTIAMRTSQMSGYRDLEIGIQDILRAIEPGVVLPFLFEHGKPTGKTSKYPPPTPRVLLGYGLASIANADSSGLNEFRRYTDPGGQQRGVAYLEGPWKLEEGQITHEEGEEAYIRVIYSGKSVWLLPNFALDQTPVVYVEQDRSRLRDDSWGKDIQIDMYGRTFVGMQYASPRQIVSNPTYGTHELKIIPAEGMVSFHYIYFDGQE